jgi:hypothetical protein
MRFQLFGSIALVFLVFGCTDSEETCEILEDAYCVPTDSGTENVCPEGYSCSGEPSFWCYKGTCDDLPVCLPSTTQISTPLGAVAISDLKIGASVWSRNLQGERVEAIVEKVESVGAPEHHRVLNLTLEDGRHFTASPGHPDIHGKALETYKIGDLLDGSAITQKSLVNYGEKRTWDLVPSGPTGHYLAEGVWLGSTLKSGASVTKD